MSENANKLTAPQALTILKQVASHKDLRFLNLEEHAAVQQALAVLDEVVNPKPAAAPLTVVQ